MTKMNRKLMLRSCPRCRGDLLLDATDQEFYCLQCGRRAAVDAAIEQAKEPVAA